MSASLVLMMPIAAAVLAPTAASAASCNTSATGDWINNCTVSEGADNRYVVVIQMIVDSQEICSSLTVDGDFGPDTLAGVKCFQREYGLTAGTESSARIRGTQCGTRFLTTILRVATTTTTHPEKGPSTSEGPTPTMPGTTAVLLLVVIGRA